VFPNVHSCVSTDSAYDLVLMLCLYIGLPVCDVLFSCFLLFFPWPSVVWRESCRTNS
jgi:hypothetical protein